MKLTKIIQKISKFITKVCNGIYEFHANLEKPKDREKLKERILKAEIKECIKVVKKDKKAKKKGMKGQAK